MKKMLLAVSLAFAATAAQAQVVTATSLTSDNGKLTVTAGNGAVINGSVIDQAFGSVAVVPSAGDDGWGGNGTTLQPAGLYTSGYTGMLSSTLATDVAFTFLGKVAGFTNNLTGYAGGVAMDDSTVGSTVIVSGVNGRVGFGFVTTVGNYGNILNGESNAAFTGMAYLDAALWNGVHGTDFDFLIGYNDPFNGNDDYDDYVVGVKAVPVPAALPLMASALGMFGIARRRKTLA
jgi:hypothetical protein